MNLYRPRLGVGTKTLIALTLVFWIPVAALAGLLYNMFSDLLYEEGAKQIRVELTGAKNFMDARSSLLEGLLVNFSQNSEIKQAVTPKNPDELQSLLIDFGNQNNFISILTVVDPSQRVIARRNENRDDFISIGGTIATAFRTGKTQKSYELVERSFLKQEDEALARLLSDLGLVHFVVAPIIKNGEVIAALVAGMMISTNTSLGNTVHSKYGSELAIFVGTPRNSFYLHATNSLPRRTWVMGQILPPEVHKTIVLGREYNSPLKINNQEIIVAVEPIQDSNKRIIGAIGVSVLSDDINSAVLNNIFAGIVVTAVIALFIALLSVFFVHHDITRPLAVIQNAMRRFGKGELNVKLDLKTGDQLELLGMGFNKMVDNVKRREVRFTKHNEVAKLFMSTLNMDELLDKTLRIVVSITDSQMGIMYMWNDEDDCLIARAQYGLSDDLKPLKLGEGFPGQAAKQREQILIDSHSSDQPDEVIEMGVKQVMPEEVVYIPLVYQNHLHGVLTLGSLKPYPEEEKQLFNYLADQISIALDNALMHQRVQELSVTDSLSGLYNRRYLNQVFEHEWSRTERDKLPISILLADVDNFKSINDEFGHDKGDEVLKLIAGVFKKNARKGDVIARYGGEEFVILLSNTSHDQAINMGERICQNTRELKFDWLNRPITLSIGVGSFPELDVDSHEQLINAADQSMYKAKTTGKDKVVSLFQSELNL